MQLLVGLDAERLCHTRYEGPSPSVEPLPAHLRFLAVADEWSSSKGGLSTFNRLLCTALSRAGHGVSCLVPGATEGERASANKAGVRLVDAAEPGLPGMTRLCLKPRDADLSPHVIIGHGRVTGNAARILARLAFPGSRVIHFVHTEPGHIEWFKGDTIPEDASRKADERTEYELDLARQADLVVGVGPVLTRWIADELLTGALSDVPIHRLDPGLTDVLPVSRRPESVHCLLLGRAEDRRLKGIDIALRALQEWTERPPDLVIRGVPAGAAGEFTSWIQSLAPRVYVRPFGYTGEEERLAADFRKASVVLMPSRREGFGLVGLEAISAGVPVLVSDRSGLGELLHEHGTSTARRAIVETSGVDDEADVGAWRRAIDGVLRNRDAAYADAARLREEVASSLDWRTAVDKLIAALLRADRS
ncbi:glycosyltransferase family 4 protein [Sorangium sp. So ce269]